MDDGQGPTVLERDEFDHKPTAAYVHMRIHGTKSVIYIQRLFRNTYLDNQK